MKYDEMGGICSTHWVHTIEAEDLGVDGKTILE
jgi:hypothetical protein